MSHPDSWQHDNKILQATQKECSWKVKVNISIQRITSVNTHGVKVEQQHPGRTEKTNEDFEKRSSIYKTLWRTQRSSPEDIGALLKRWYFTATVYFTFCFDTFTFIFKCNIKLCFHYIKKCFWSVLKLFWQKINTRQRAAGVIYKVNNLNETKQKTSIVKSDLYLITQMEQTHQNNRENQCC